MHFIFFIFFIFFFWNLNTDAGLYSQWLSSVVFVERKKY